MGGTHPNTPLLFGKHPSDSLPCLHSRSNLFFFCLTTLHLLTCAVASPLAERSCQLSCTDHMPKSRLLKAVVLGDAGCGKTCLLKRFVSDEFEDHYRATIGMSCGDSPSSHALVVTLVLHQVKPKSHSFAHPPQ